ncbi:DUF986 family protein [Xenorhabdus bovienii]|uniref:UPF0266 membrane protein KKJ01_13985 n=1 Tax=Xenorhabdus bovienii TaxID=40576 RepID=A0AAJ1J8V1_XENBV|nr:DUF986 family protein [Xenorhabdus bovienii]MDE1479310.1 DUF986 family protein [Xenorhabdus bovienii]MDE1491682.1 DUF986 family protein [Xenorhabdus bovienii]MDE9510989.1 DUF986 family protein [Xenorhabdus bovienii]MDE9522646.1 DUF986 family protein [Xenorhabdus bovienii]
MSLNDIILIILILLMLAFAIYDEFIINQIKGKTLLNIKLKRKHRIDALIFIVLISIVIYNNVIVQGNQLTTHLLLFIILVTIYLGYMRSPKLIFKKQGFYYANRFFQYKKINTMNLSEDGILMISFEKNNIYITVRKLDDLEEIYQFLVNNR